MGTFNYNRFNREINHPASSAKALAYLIKNLNEDVISFSEFWQSEKRCDLSVEDFLEHYFNGKDTSDLIVEYFFSSYSQAFIDVARRCKVFRKTRHFEIIKEVIAPETPIITELNFWNGCFSESRNQIEYINTQTLSKLCFEEVLLLCGFYYEKLRISKSIYRNTDNQLIHVVSEILNYKIKNTRYKADGTINELDSLGFVRLGKVVFQKLVHGGDTDIAQIFQAFDRKLELEYLYDKYCLQNFELNCSDPRSIVLKPSNREAFIKFKRNGFKYPFWNNYHQNNFALLNEDVLESIQTSDASWYNKVGQINARINFFQYIELGLPEMIPVGDNKNVSALHCFQILNSLASWTNIRWNNLIEMHILDNSLHLPYEVIEDVMVQNQHRKNTIFPICDRSYDQLVRQTQEILKLEADDSRSCLKLLTNNLSDTKRPLNLLETPFIKYGKNVYWIAGIFSNKNYCITLQNILQRSSEVARKDVAKYSEEKLQHFFDINSYKTVINHHYLDHNGEIDLLALKGNYLFIAQIKSTYTRTTVEEITEHRQNDETGIEKAINQLKRDVAYLRVYWEQIRQELGTELDFDEVMIVPLAVTTSLEDSEGRFNISGCDGFIASAFDLELVLCNKKGLLFNITEMALSDAFPNGIPAEYIMVSAGILVDELISSKIATIVDDNSQQMVDRQNNDLWKKGKSHCSPIDLITALSEKTVWDFLPERIELTDRQLILGNFTIKYVD
jgi:hypothetical protein